MIWSLILFFPGRLLSNGDCVQHQPNSKLTLPRTWRQWNRYWPPLQAVLHGDGQKFDAERTKSYSGHCHFRGKECNSDIWKTWRHTVHEKSLGCTKRLSGENAGNSVVFQKEYKVEPATHVFEYCIAFGGCVPGKNEITAARAWDFPVKWIFLAHIIWVQIWECPYN